MRTACQMGLHICTFQETATTSLVKRHAKTTASAKRALLERWSRKSPTPPVSSSAPIPVVQVVSVVDAQRATPATAVRCSTRMSAAARALSCRVCVVLGLESYTKCPCSIVSGHLHTLHLCSFSTADAVHAECGRRLPRKLLLLVLHHYHCGERVLLLPIAGYGRHRM